MMRASVSLRKYKLRLIIPIRGRDRVCGEGSEYVTPPERQRGGPHWPTLRVTVVLAVQTLEEFQLCPYHTLV